MPASSDTHATEELLNVHLRLTAADLAILACVVDADQRLRVVSYQLDLIFEQARRHPRQLELGV